MPAIGRRVARKRAIAASLLSAAALFASTGSSGAAVPMGTTGPEPTAGCGASTSQQSCFVVPRVDAPSAGVLVRFRFKHGPAQAGTLVAFKTVGLQGQQYQVIQSTPTMGISTAAETLVHVPTDANGRPKGLRIGQGQRMGVYVRNPSDSPPRVAFISLEGGPGFTEYGGQNPGPGELTSGIAALITNATVLLAADLEPDADLDGYGDETQDNCPSVPNDQTSDPCRPNTLITGTPPSPTKTTSASFRFTADEYGVTFECRLDAATDWSPCGGATPTTAAGEERTALYTGLSEGDHTFRVRARDALGPDTTEATHAWRIDTTPPNTSIDGGPTGLTNSRTAAFTLTSTEPGSSFECKLNNGPVEACGSPKEFTGLPDGAYTLSVWATDAAGNRDETPATRQWTVDATQPVVEITSGPAEGSRTRSTAATFEFRTESGAGLACRLDDADFVDCSSPWTYTGLSDATHEFTVAAVDAAGNVGTAMRRWTVDTTPPDTFGNGELAPPDPTTSTAAYFEFWSNEAGSTFECRLDDQPFGACTSPTTYSNLALGRHLFEVRATDLVGNTDPTPARWVWNILASGAPPAPPATGDRAFIIGTNVTVLQVFTSLQAALGTINSKLNGLSARKVAGFRSIPHPFAVPLAGRMTFTWAIPANFAKRLGLRVPRGARTVVIARGVKIATAAGKATVQVRLSASAKKALRKARKLRVILIATFQPAAGGDPIEARSAFTLRR